jgi:hypothetical protein
MSELARYLRQHDRVPGWLQGYSARFIAEIGRIQAQERIDGAATEIGVHMGRLFILLSLLARPDETSLAIDVFGDQVLNVDGSGGGDLARFKANVARFAPRARFEVLQRSSLDLVPQDIVERVGHCRLFSIDGGHTEECALNDLKLADAVLTEMGVVILDDYFNESWPDVSTGAARFLSDPATRLRPFAITPNKLYLTRPGAHAFYCETLRVSQHDLFEKESRMFGSPVHIFGVEAETWLPLRRLRRALKRSVLGPPLLVAKRRLAAAVSR